MNIAFNPTKTLEADHEIDVIVRQLEESVVRKYTAAPLRLGGQMVFKSTALNAFKHFSDPHLMVSWFPTLTKISLNHADSCSAGEIDKTDTGSVRTCHMRGMGTLKEKILHWDAPNSYAYSASNWMMPIKNHVSLIFVVQLSHNKSLVVWNHYYDFTGVLMRHMFPFMMSALMNKGIKELAARIGGTGGRIKTYQPEKG